MLQSVSLKGFSLRFSDIHCLQSINHFTSINTYWCIKFLFFINRTILRFKLICIHKVCNILNYILSGFFKLLCYLNALKTFKHTLSEYVCYFSIAARL